MAAPAFRPPLPAGLPPRAAGSRCAPARACAPRRLVTCIAPSFERAVRSGFVLDFGRTLHVRPDLSVVESHPLRVPHQLEPPLREVGAAILRFLGRRRVVAIFVRGSCATQHFFDDGTSDLDLVVVTNAQVPRATLQSLTDCIKAALSSSKLALPVDLTCINQSCISPSLAVVLRYYALSLYTSAPSPLAATRHVNLNISTMPINIRDDERRCMAVFPHPNHHHTFSPLKLCAVQWLCKRCLRSLTELAVSKTRKHARDLVPCYKLCSAAYPEHAHLFLSALQVACAHERNAFVGEGRESILPVALDTVRSLVELVEDVFLKETFNSDACSFSSGELQTAFIAAPKFRERVLHSTEQTVAGLLYWFRKTPASFFSFARCALPKTCVRRSRQVAEKALEGNLGVGEHDLNPFRFLVDCDEPFVVRGLRRPEVFQTVFTAFVKKHMTVSCRVSPTNVVTFCRSEHSWIEDRLFTPSSTIRSLMTTEAVQRLQKDCILPALEYEDAVREHLYIQTDAFRSEALFDRIPNKNINIVQKERIWISTHGTVSSLHYDASHSALFQRTGMKRMLFFPPECLDKLGIYPLGHPLHRRARVSLDHRKSRVFREFWTGCASVAVEAVLRPGDLVVFPPNWSHYTESLAQREQLSVSHTVRYICPVHFSPPS